MTARLSATILILEKKPDGCDRHQESDDAKHNRELSQLVVSLGKLVVEDQDYSEVPNRVCLLQYMDLRVPVGHRLWQLFIGCQLDAYDGNSVLI